MAELLDSPPSSANVSTMIGTEMEIQTIKICMTCREPTNQVMTQEHDGDEPTGTNLVDLRRLPLCSNPGLDGLE